MNAELKEYLAEVKLGDAQTYKRITIVPLIGPTNGEPNYLTLAEAKDTKFDAGQAHDRARSFLEETALCEEKRFPSIGHGEDCRFKKPGLAGRALVHERQTVPADMVFIPPGTFMIPGLINDVGFRVVLAPIMP